MADYQFVASGRRISDAIKFYPRDEQNNEATGVTLSLSGAGCAGASLVNVRATTDDQGASCLLADINLPSSVPNGACNIVASAGGTTCTCSLAFLAQIPSCNNISYDMGDSCEPGESFGGSIVFMDQEGNPYLGDDIEISLSNNATLQSFIQGIDGEWMFTALTGNEPGTVQATFLHDGFDGVCRFDIKEIVQGAAPPPVDAGMDCGSLQAALNDYVCLVEGELRFAVDDTDGNEIVDGITVTSAFGATDVSYELVNNEWRVRFTPTSEAFRLRVVHGDEICLINGTAAAINCGSLNVVAGNYTIGQAGQVQFSVEDSTGSAISSGLSFIGDRATITSSNYANGRWVVNFIPTASTFEIEINQGTKGCSINGTAQGAQSDTINCQTVTCEVIGSELVVGQPGKFVVNVRDQSGSPVPNGVDFELTGATLDDSAYSTTLQGWVLDITPTSDTIVGSILTSALGNCANFCSLNAIIAEMDCDAVSCDVISGTFELGQQQSIVVVLRDNTGAPITQGAQFNFAGATIDSTPIYSASLQSWVIDLTPTADTVVGTSITTPLGNCNNFCAIETSVEEKCCGEIASFSLPSANVGQAYTGRFLVNGVTAEITGLPVGMSYNSTTGAISGTPTTPENVVIGFSYGGCSFEASLHVQSTAVSTGNCCPKLVNVSIPTGIVGDPYEGFAVFSGVGARTYSATGLPPGIVVNPSTGQFTGVPTNSDNYVSTLTVSDSRGTCTYSVTFDVDDDSVSDCPKLPKITAVPRLVSAVGEPVALMLFASQGARFEPKQIGNGLTMDNMGAIRGTPDQAGVTSFDVTVVDDDGNVCTQSLVYTVLGESGTPTSDDCITSLSFCICCGRKQMIAVGATSTQYEIEGDLPDGLVFAAGSIVGTPSRKGSYPFTIKPGNGLTVQMMIVVEDCGEASCSIDDDICPTPVKSNDKCPIRLIECASIAGVEYRASRDTPSCVIWVDAEQRDFLLNNGMAYIEKSEMK